MELRDKFQSYRSPYDEAAWTHFQELRKKRRKRRLFFLWFLYGVGFSLLSGTMLYYGFTESRYASIFQVVSSTTQSKTVDNREIQSAIAQDSSYTEKKVRSNVDKEFVEDSERRLKEGSIRRYKESDSQMGIDNAISSFNAILDSSVVSISGPAETVLIDSDYKSDIGFVSGDHVFMRERELQKFKSSLVVSPHLSNAQELLDGSVGVLNTTDVNIALSNLSFLLKSYIQPLKIDLDLPNLENRLVKVKEAEKLVSSSNYLKLQLGYGSATINGFSLDEPISKRGGSVFLKYRREINNLLSIGFGGGYIAYRDVNNPLDPMRDEEIILFLHGNVHFNFYNENKHRAYALIGAGPARTHRSLAGFRIRNGVIIGRTFQVNTLFSLSVGVEAGYEYSLTGLLSLGAYYNMISHNDGGWNVGISLTHKI